MADIVLTVDVSSVSNAEKKVKEFGKALKDVNVGSLISGVSGLQGKINQLVEAQKNGVINSKTYNTGLLEIKRAYEALGYSSQQATAAVRAYARQLQQQEAARQAAEAARQLARAQEEAALATKRLADRQRELRMRFQEGYAQFSQQRQAMRDLREAYRSGIITLQQYEAQLLRIRNLTQNPGNIAGVGGVGVAIQQVGYQVGDFAVQIQSGTNAFVAFGQQATQLVGILPLVHTQLGLTAMQAIGLSTGLGIIIPIVTAFGAAWSRSRQQAAEAKKAFDPLEERLKSIDRVISEWKFEKQAKILNFDPDQFAATTELEKREKELIAAKEKLDRVLQQSSNATLAVGSGASSGLAQAIANWMLVGDATEEQIEAIETYNAALLKLANLKQKMASDSRASYLEEKRQLEDTTALEIAKVRYGNDSLQVKKLASEQNRKSYISDLEAKKLTDLQIAALLTIYDQRQAELALAEEISKKYDTILKTMEAISGVDISGAFYDATTAVETMNARLDNTLSKIGGILAAIGSIGFDTIAIQAETKALKAGKSKGQAVIEGQLARDEAAAKQGGALDPITVAGLAAKRAALEERLAAQEANKVELDRIKEASGSGSKKKEQEDYLLSLLKEANYKKSIIGLSEQEARRKEIIFQLTEKGLPIEDARIKKVLEAEAALKKATEAEDRRKSMLDRISSSMEEAFMSMVDGSKSVSDAFKGMLREILLDIYRQQVAKPISSGISDIIGNFLGGGSGDLFGGASWSANGNIVGKSGIQAFANGGVVGSATMFKHGGGLGVMGEAGPEAIMPLKRGKNGKLGVQMDGSSGAVNVTQVFNFSANGDESVKKIIAQAAPQIAMMTQKQIMDSRRRGGSMKATFG